MEVYYSGEWGTVCDDGWDNADATVVCRQLGFYGTARAYGSAQYGQGTGPILLSRLSCVGNESSLVDCSRSSAQTKNCTHSDDAVVHCDSYYYYYYYYQYRYIRCEFLITNVCVYSNICTLIDIGLPIRLANGTNEKEGRVEMYWNNQWSTVCDDRWDDNDATVICKQLGYSRGSARVSAYFGEGSGLILLDNVNCNGGESSIFECHHNNFGEHDCSHNEDAGVVCYGESSKSKL